MRLQGCKYGAVGFRVEGSELRVRSSQNPKHHPPSPANQKLNSFQREGLAMKVASHVGSTA